MHQLAEFSPINELAPLGSEHRVFQAEHAEFGKVFLLQQARPNVNRLQQGRPDFLAPSLAEFEEEHWYYQVFSAAQCPLSFSQLQQHIQSQGQHVALNAIIGLTRLLLQAHLAGYIFKELCAEALFWSKDGNQVLLLSCPQASTLQTVRPGLGKATLTLQSLRTLAPEASGRINSPLDQRADLYSLGVLAYALLAGEFPFAQQDPLALIHAHIAKIPKPLTEQQTAKDDRLQLIIQALLQKDPNHRYQSVAAVLDDFERCLQPDHEESPFTPSLHSGMQRLPFSDHLYEREQDVDTLLQAFNQISRGAGSQLVVVRGYSGSGKTSLIEQLPPKTLGTDSFFIQGKQDQYLQNRFYSALSAALAQLAEAILQEPADALQHWRQQLQDAAAGDAHLLCELVPEWQPLLQPEMHAQYQATGITELRRFDQLTFRLLHVVAAQGYSLILFLDDLQWADRATLRWLEQLAKEGDKLRLLLLLSYRDNEVQDQHPLSFTLDALKRSGLEQHQLELKPLSSQSILQLVSDTLQTSPDEVVTLAELLLQKTSGNPFYLKQLMQKLYETQLLQHEQSTGWHWDSKAIAQLNITDNHAAITSERLSRFSVRIQHLFQWIALLGESASMQQLAELAEISLSGLEQELTEAINSGILIAYTTADGKALDAVRFAHDRLQQAAFQLSDQANLQQLNLQIALHQYNKLSPEQQNSEVLGYIHHFNAALPLSLTHCTAERLAELNLLAGQKALSSNAYHSAQRLFQQAKSLLEQQAKPRLQTDILLGLARSAYLSQHYELAWENCQQLAAVCQEPVQRLQNCQQQVLILFAQNQLHEAYDLASQELQAVGLDICIDESIIRQYPELLKEYDADSISSLLQRPEVKDPLQLQVMEILGMLFTVAYIISPLHYMTVSYQLMAISLRQGHSNGSALAYLGHAMHLIALFGQYDKALEFADLALQVDAGFTGKFRAQLHFQRAAAVLPWNAPLADSLEALDESQQLGLKDGQLEYAAHSVLFASFYRVLSGQALDKVQRYGEQSIQFLTEKQFPYNLAFCQLWHQSTLALQGPAESAHLLEGDSFRESTQLSDLQQPHNTTLLFCYHQLKLMHAYWFDTGEEATHLQQAEPLVDVALALYHQTEFHFFRGLAAARQLKIVPDDPQQSWQQRLQDSLEKLQNWAKQCPQNYQHKVLLLQAEQAALEHQANAWQLYQQAIVSAEQQGFSQHLALAHELAADYWQRQQQPTYALAHRAAATSSYLSWKCLAKAEQLQQKYPELKQHPLLQSQQESQVDQQLDLASVLKAAETLTGRVDLDAFLLRMLQLMAENAGAEDACLLMLSETDQLQLQACTLAKPPLLPEKLLNLVQRSKTSRLINDTSQSSIFTAVENRPCAVLCIPIVVSDSFRGILYLQHQKLIGAFQQERVKVLQLLANQTAILFENTRLSQQLLEANKNLEQKIASRTRELAQAKIRAEAATEAKSAFLARMSHEIRTPINAVIGLSRLASKSCQDPEQQDYLKKIRGSGEMLLSLINDILDFSKVEAGKLTLEKNRFSLSQVVQQAIHMTALKAHSKGLELVSDLSAEIPAELIGDSLRIQQLLVNLLNNAIKFTDTGSVCLMLHGSRQPEGRYKLHGSVTDTGIGMTEQQQQKLFKSFNQADESITRRYGGSGLGLTICKQLCELMQGEIWLESEAGYGTTFYFTIELSVSAVQPSQKHHALAKRQLKALVVDDMALTRMVLLKQLDELGVQAEQCSNGMDAIERIEKAEANQTAYDFVLMDWRMPGMDGIETTRSIQQRLGSRSPHILMVSAYDKAQAKASMADVTIEHFLEKPVNYSMLLDAISPLLYQQQAGDSEQATPEQNLVPDLSQKRLLLVEDHPINRQVALGFLQDTNAQIDCAEHGLAALQLLQQQHYDLVLMDIQMPQMDGLTACRKIRQELKLTSLPVIAMTAHALPDDIEKSLAVGMNAHLTKPIEPEQLYQTLQSFLGVRMLAVAPGNTSPRAEPADQIVPAPKGAEQESLLNELKARTNLGPQAAIYPSLLHIFYNEHKGLPGKLRHQLQHQDINGLLREMHSLKAAAAYIGAFHIAEQCNQMEARLRDPQPDCSALPPLLMQLEQLLELLASKLQQLEPPAKQTLSKAEFKQELLQLKPMLEQSDFAADRLLERLMELSKASEFYAKIAELSHTVADVEFELASQQLQALLQQLETE
ncbi:response regulator [Alkalimonas amylolytica]|uniref:histidine kinase n=1 Tax=Alkalimonas amylolytica TaxID=152573 RepID=A0A1H3ZVA1_ALKAM|nr:response regulator [Alkalimonas amylolytica]SEA27575.1 serine/threonine protein kinase and signal transduction histidine kinase with GAF sensor [Alkalimonas amylolytica]